MGSIAKPIIISQKKNLAGLGKDRDEAFPFWDHVFSAAVSSIQIKIAASDDEDSDSESSNSPSSSKSQLKRTSTGIISNRRPLSGIAADSGSTTPTTSNDEEQVVEEGPGRRNIMSMAKQEAARKGLYARFFRGPVLGPDPVPETQESAVRVTAYEKGKGKAQESDPRCDIPEAETITTTLMTVITSKKRMREDADLEGHEYPSPHFVGALKEEPHTQEQKKKKKKRKRRESEQSLAGEPVSTQSRLPHSSTPNTSPGKDTPNDTPDSKATKSLTKVVKRAYKQRQKREEREKELKEVKKTLRSVKKGGETAEVQTKIKELKKRVEKLQKKLDGRAVS
jgi:hypothetical protein